ncbi:MAG: hypothetical protein GC154_10590 [bacterium]|nr:hypothetical protein [bacterium]
MAEGYQSPFIVKGLFNTNFGLNGLFNRNQNANSSPLNLLGGALNKSNNANNGLASLVKSPLTHAPVSSTRDASNDKSDGKDKDKVDLSNFAKDAADKAVESARKNGLKPGVTNQVIVSDDGRFEASIDLRKASDGSFSLDLAVKFAQSSVTGLSSTQGQAVSQQPQPKSASDSAVKNAADQDEATAPDVPAEEASGDVDQGDSVSTDGTSSPQPQFQDGGSGLSYSGLQAYAARYTSFEQQLSTRDFQANIFYEESKAVALKASQAHGNATGANVLDVAKGVAHEFTLNISISGADLNNFNDIADQLSQFDDTGTLSGFLDAARGVLSADSSNLGSFVDATKGLIDSARDHVASKLGNFFSGLSQQSNPDLESLGFTPEFFQNVGEDVQKDLGQFFSLTNNFLSQLGGGNALPQDQQSQTAELLQKNMDALREQQKKELEKAKEEVSQPRGVNTYTPADQPQASLVDELA